MHTATTYYKRRMPQLSFAMIWYASWSLQHRFNVFPQTDQRKQKVEIKGVLV